MYEKKKLEDMNLLDNFLFGSLVTYPILGEEFTRRFLKIIFGREFKRLLVVPQKIYYGDDSNLHGARLDVYIEEEASEEDCSVQATVYDMEPDKNVGAVKALPRRIRFYHAKLDSKSLASGVDYNSLKNVIVIMIMPYDPFGFGRMVYTIKNRCVEIPDMEYEDGATTLFLYTKGKQENNEDLEQLLRYMEDTRDVNAVNADLAEIHNMVRTVKRDAEVSVAYMRMMEDIEMLMKQGHQEGLEQGLEQGHYEGLEEGLVLGRTEGANLMKKAFRLVSKGLNTVDALVAEGIPEDIAISALTED